MIRKNGKKSINILADNGNEWSDVAREIESIYFNWLDASELDENEFISSICEEDMYLTYFEDERMALTIFHHSCGEIGMPMVWQVENEIPLDSYKTDTALLLLYIAGKCNNKLVTDKIESFVKTELLVNKR